MPERILSLKNNPEQAFQAMYSVLTDIRNELGEVRVSSAIQAEKMTQVCKHQDWLESRIIKSEVRLDEFGHIKDQGEGGKRVIGWVVGASGSIAAVVSWAVNHIK